MPFSCRRALPVAWALLLLPSLAWCEAPRAKGPARTDWHGEALPAGARARLGGIRLQNEPLVVDDVALSPDGSLLATGGSIGPLRLWDVRTGRLVRKLPLH